MWLECAAVRVPVLRQKKLCWEREDEAHEFAELEYYDYSVTEGNLKRVDTLPSGAPRG
jgi:hypothetical protein